MGCHLSGRTELDMTEATYQIELNIFFSDCLLIRVMEITELHPSKIPLTPSTSEYDCLQIGSLNR